jgi:hypothetical protein
MRISPHSQIGFALLSVVSWFSEAQALDGPGTLLATGQTVTPEAATGARFIELNPGLKASDTTPPLLGDQAPLSTFIAGQPKTTALSADGSTLLILTTGFNRLNGVDGKAIPELSNEYLFVYNVSHRQSVLRQVLQVPNSFDGLAFSPDARRFYVSGGMDDSVHVFERGAGGWAESGAPIKMHDAGARPMSDVFDLKQAAWSFHAVPSRMLRDHTQLPLPPASAEELALRSVKPRHTRARWSAAMSGLDFSKEDKNDAQRFNRILWTGTMGDKPYPVRSGRAAQLAAVDRD